MISFLTGAVAGRGAGFALIDVHGVGFRLLMSGRSLAALPADGDPVTVHTHLHVREDELTMFGFANAQEREGFEELLGVNGVGPKVALAVLSAIAVDDLAAAVAAEDVALLSSVPGVGKKTAQRIIVDLADRLGTRVDLSGASAGGAAGAAAVAVVVAAFAASASGGGANAASRTRSNRN